MFNEVRIDRQSRQTKNDRSKSTIYLRVHLTGDGRRSEFILSTKCYIDTTQWDSNKKRVKGNSTESTRYNKKIRDYEDTVHKCFEEIKRNEPVTIPKLKATLNFKIFGIQSDRLEKQLYLPDLFDRYLENHKSKIGHSRKGRYVFVKRKAIEFTEKTYATANYDINRLSKDWFDKFHEFLFEGFKYKNPTMTGYQKVLKAVVNDAYKSKLIKEHPFVDCPLNYTETSVHALTKDELETLINYKFEDETLQLLADCFVFGTQTGLAHTDLKNLSYSMIQSIDGRNVICKNRNKTDGESIIAVTGIAQKIMDKYKGHPKIQGTGLVLPVMNINSYNTKLKLIAAKCGIYSKLTSHIARHTFATTIWLDGSGSMETLQRILGHQEMKSTQKYGKITAKRILDESERVLQLK